MPQTSNLTNHFLIAMPALDDPNFSQTVTYVCEHSSEGAMGIIINRPLEMTLGDVFDQMSIESTDPGVNQDSVYSGGPVSAERGFVLHSPTEPWTSTLAISEQVSVTTSRDILEAVASCNGPEHTLVALGYAGWASGQLESEIADNAWLSGPANPDILFHTPVSDRWSAAARVIGVDLNLMSSDAGHA